MFESFTLSENIAGDCEFKTSLQSEGDCGYDTRNGIIFTDSVGGCVYKRPDNTDNVCYHVPYDNSELFNS